jgi:hypothetical protein
VPEKEHDTEEKECDGERIGLFSSEPFSPFHELKENSWVEPVRSFEDRGDWSLNSPTNAPELISSSSGIIPLRQSPIRESDFDSTADVREKPKIPEINSYKNLTQMVFEE